MSAKTSRKATTSTMEGPEKMQPRSSKQGFSSFWGESEDETLLLDSSLDNSDCLLERFRQNQSLGVREA